MRFLIFLIEKKDYMIKNMSFLYEIHQTSGYSIYRLIGNIVLSKEKLYFIC